MYTSIISRIQFISYLFTSSTIINMEIKSINKPLVNKKNSWNNPLKCYIIKIVKNKMGEMGEGE